MSLEAAAEEERLKVMRRLEEATKPKKPKSPSLNPDRSESPISPVRSMLDVSSGPVPRHGSIAGIGVGITDGTSGPKSPTYRSMLDITTPITVSPQHVGTPLTSSAPTQPLSQDQRRSSADPITSPSQGLPRIDDGDKKDPLQKHQFGMLPSITSHALPKRAAQGGKKTAEAQPPKAMAAAISGDLSTLPGFARAREGRHNSTVGIGGKSRSPSSRLPPRSESPAALSLSVTGSTMPSNAYVTDSGKVVDMDKAYRKLSNRSHGSSSFSTDNSTEFAEGGRIHEDPIEDEADEAAVDSSEEDDDGELSTDEDDMSPEAARGRRRSRRKKGSMGSEGDLEESETGSGSTLGMGQAQGPRQVKSLMAAAEDERKSALFTLTALPILTKYTGKKVSSHYAIKSLLEPEISVTSPSGEKLVSKKGGVYPNTSFDENPASAASSAPSSEIDGDFSDIKRAQKLSINMSLLDTSVSNRTIRTILRGNWPAMEEEVKQERRRARLYIVATDLSDEALYALEWTIGTILRDGDTMIAIYAIDEEATANKGTEFDAKGSVQFGEGVKVALDMAKSMASQTEKTKQNPIVAHSSSTLAPSNYMPATDTKSLTGSVDSRAMSKQETERFHAVENISQTCIKLLRKTRLQVRIFVEVIHCKSPKHMLTGAVSTSSKARIYNANSTRSTASSLISSFSDQEVGVLSKVCFWGLSRTTLLPNPLCRSWWRGRS
jgi:hypothetical protein